MMTRLLVAQIALGFDLLMQREFVSADLIQSKRLPAGLGDGCWYSAPPATVRALRRRIGANARRNAFLCHLGDQMVEIGSTMPEAAMKCRRNVQAGRLE
jgi:hypothetical protein